MLFIYKKVIRFFFRFMAKMKVVKKSIFCFFLHCFYRFVVNFYIYLKYNETICYYQRY